MKAVLSFVLMVFCQVIAPPASSDKEKEPTKKPDGPLMITTVVKGKTTALPPSQLTVALLDTIKRYESPESGQAWKITEFNVTSTELSKVSAKSGGQAIIAGTAIAKIRGESFPMLFVKTTETNRPVELVPQAYVQ